MTSNNGLSNDRTTGVQDGNEKVDVEKYLWNGHKSRIVPSGLLNTSAVTSNASLLAILLKEDSLDTYARVSMGLVITSVILQMITGFILALEYRANIKCEADKKLLTEKRRRPRKWRLQRQVEEVEIGGTTDPTDDKLEESLWCWAKPMEYQFTSVILLILLNLVNTFVIAFLANINLSGQRSVDTPIPS